MLVFSDADVSDSRRSRISAGLVMLARKKEVAKKIADEILGKTVRKTYFARVTGKFPEHSFPSADAAVAPGYYGMRVRFRISSDSKPRRYRCDFVCVGCANLM